MEIFAHFFEIYKKHINTLYGQNAHFMLNIVFQQVTTSCKW